MKSAISVNHQQASDLLNNVTRKSNVLLSMASMALLFAAPMVCAADLTVVVENIQQDSGVVRVGLFNTESSFLKTVFKGAFAPAMQREANGALTLIFRDIEPGQYALSAYHDVNQDDKLNSNLMGLPTEPYGFSNNAQGQFGPPAFKDAVFHFPAQGATTYVRVK